MRDDARGRGDAYGVTGADCHRPGGRSGVAHRKIVAGAVQTQLVLQP